MSIVSNIFGRNDATAASYPQTGLPNLSGQPTSNVPSGPGYGVTDAYTPDAYTPDTYQPVNYRVPTNVPALAPAAVTAWRAQETMMPEIVARQVPVIKEVPVETVARATRASRAARAAETTVTAEASTAAQTAETAAKTTKAASRAKAGQAALQEGTTAAVESGATETVQATKQVKTMKTKVTATPKLTMTGLWGAVKTSALVSGAISLALNGYAVIKKQQTFAEGGANVVGDVAAGAVGGVGGAVASAFGAPLIAGALGIAGGFPLTALTFGLGLGGYWLADKLFRNTGLFKSLKADVHSLLSGNPSAVQAPMPAATNTIPFASNGQVPSANPYPVQP